MVRGPLEVPEAPDGSPVALLAHESDGAWPHVEALAALGITAGCGGGKYRPDATQTRRPMAVFLSKALGLHWPD